MKLIIYAIGLILASKVINIYDKLLAKRKKWKKLYR
ncbi:hypothetical protein V760_02594 [Staphylococcus aureus F23613]|nr:hypothetical protein V760_02594 [Staphylococcus aureus F23613]